jgi:glycosyltransferase involved in cell wall biosynthesis
MSEKQIKTPPVSNRVKIYYVANARMPTEKAHGIQIAKMCEALIEAGAEVELIAPRRANTSRTIQDFYGLRVSVPTVYIWTPDWYSRGRLGFWASSVCFMVGYALYLLKKKRPGAGGAIWTIDVDQFSFFFIPYLGMPYIAEIHDAKPSTFTFRALFRRAARIVVINDIISRELGDIFKIPSGRISVHPNGVDLYHFQARSKGEARRKLQLPFDTRVALYVGRLYQW